MQPLLAHPNEPRPLCASPTFDPPLPLPVQILGERQAAQARTSTGEMSDAEKALGVKLDMLLPGGRGRSGEVISEAAVSVQPGVVKHVVNDVPPAVLDPTAPRVNLSYGQVGSCPKCPHHDPLPVDRRRDRPCRPHETAACARVSNPVPAAAQRWHPHQRSAVRSRSWGCCPSPARTRRLVPAGPGARGGAARYPRSL